MKVTYHAIKRFLERVLHKTKWTRAEFNAARVELEKMFASIIPGSYGRGFPLPDYKGFQVVHRDNTVITILDKKSMKKRKGRR